MPNIYSNLSNGLIDMKNKISHGFNYFVGFLRSKFVGANVNYANRSKLFMAINSENIEQINLLLSNGASPNENLKIAAVIQHGTHTHEDIMLITPFKFAVYKLQSKIAGLQIFVTKINNDNLKDDWDIIKTLINSGANLDEGDVGILLKSSLICANADFINLLILKDSALVKTTLNSLLDAATYTSKKDLSDIINCLFELAKTSNNLLLITYAILLHKQIYLQGFKEINSLEIISPNAKAKKYFSERSVTMPSADYAFAMIRDLIVERINAEDPEKCSRLTQILDAIQNSKSSFDQMEINFEHGDMNVSALMWLTGMIVNRAINKNNEYVIAIDDLMVSIIACRSSLLLDNSPTEQSKFFDDVLVMQLHNGAGTCPQRTPAFLEVVIESYLNTVAPQQLQESQQERLKKSVVNVIDNMLRAHFTVLKENIANVTQLQEKMTQACEALTTIGADNAGQMLISKDPIKGKYTDEEFGTQQLQLRTQIMYNAFPNFDLFKDAVIKNMQYSEQELSLTENDIDYLRLMYIAIANNEIVEKLSQSYNNSFAMLLRERELDRMPTVIANAFAAYKSDKTQLRNFKNVLGQQISILGKNEVDLGERDTEIQNIVYSLTDESLDAVAISHRLRKYIR